MQSDQRNSINMNPSYTLLRLKIRCLKNASWAGKSERLPYGSQTGTVMDPQPCPSCRAWSCTVLEFPQANTIVPAVNWNVIEMWQISICQAPKKSNSKAQVGFLYGYWNCTLTSFFHSSNKRSYTRPSLSHSVFQHISLFRLALQLFSPL